MLDLFYISVHHKKLITPAYLRSGILHPPYSRTRLSSTAPEAPPAHQAGSIARTIGTNGGGVVPSVGGPLHRRLRRRFRPSCHGHSHGLDHGLDLGLGRPPWRRCRSIFPAEAQRRHPSRPRLRLRRPAGGAQIRHCRGGWHRQDLGHGGGIPIPGRGRG